MEFKDLNGKEKDMNRIESLFAQQVCQFPKQLAVKDDIGSLTYLELDEKSSIFAKFLQDKYNLQTGDFVPILASTKRKEIIIAILAILKCGASYVPINLKNSHLQIQTIINDIQPKLCLFTNQPVDEFSQLCGEIFILSEMSETLNEIDLLATHSEKTSKSTIPVSTNDIAYIAFTSGTTGRSKGVLVTHTNLLATFESWSTVFNLEKNDVHLQMANVAFDVFTGDWIRALCSGATLVMCQSELLLQPDKLYELITREQITFAEFVPAVINRLVDYCLKQKVNLNSMRILISGSDKWLMKNYCLTKKVCGPKTRIINSYGTAEATIDSTFYEENPANDESYDSLIVPIGKPFPHVEIYVLDENFQPVSDGNKGEIFIGGTGVSQGYFENIKLTNEKFLPDPFSKYGNAMMYRTGDLGYILPDGNIVFSGRNQFQVKVSGQRVELTDVETVISQHPKVEQAVVVPNFQDNNVTQLSAYILFNDDDVSYFEIISYLRQHMPYYSMPNRLFSVSEISLTTNNKIDSDATVKNVLREIHPHIEDIYSPLESKIIEIWQKILGITNVDVTHKFLELGGTSLLYSLMIDKVNSNFNVNIPHVIELHTVREIAKYIESLTETEDEVVSSL